MYIYTHTHTHSLSLSLSLSLCECIHLCTCVDKMISLDPFYWAWLPMAKTPFSDNTAILVLDKLKDTGFVQSLVDELRKVFKVSL